MKKVNWLLILMFAVTSIIFSCKKDKDEPCAFTEANFAGSYKLESVKYKLTPTSPEIDGSSYIFEPCELDDVTAFNTDHTYVISDVGTTCNPVGGDNGTWSLTGTNSLIIDGETVPIESFTCSNFSISDTDVDTQGDKLTITFKKQ